MEDIIGHLQTKFGYKQTYGWKVINHNSLAGKLSHLTSFDLLPTYVTFDLIIAWRFSRSNYQPSLALNRPVAAKLFKFCKRHGRTEAIWIPLIHVVSLHLGGFDKKQNNRKWKYTQIMESLLTFELYQEELHKHDYQQDSFWNSKQNFNYV